MKRACSCSACVGPIVGEGGRERETKTLPDNLAKRCCLCQAPALLSLALLPSLPGNNLIRKLYFVRVRPIRHIEEA